MVSEQWYVNNEVATTIDFDKLDKKIANNRTQTSRPFSYLQSSTIKSRAQSATATGILHKFAATKWVQNPLGYSDFSKKNHRRPKKLLTVNEA